MNKRKKRYLGFIFAGIIILFCLGNFMNKETSPTLFHIILYVTILVIGTNLGALIGEYLPTPKKLKELTPDKHQNKHKKK